MRSNYKALGKYIQPIDERNNTLEDLPLMGLSVSKNFFPTIANLVGTDMKTYKIVYRNQFTYIADTSRRGDKIAIALNDRFDKMLVSQAYTPFEVNNTNELNPEYLMMWFRRPEFDRYARFMSHGSAREIFGWDDMCNTLLPIPTIHKQREIVAEYNTIQNRIKLNEQLIQKLEETAQAIYREWFVEFEFPDENGKLYKTNGGEMVWNEELGKEIPKGWLFSPISNYMTINSGFAFNSKWWKNFGLPVIKIGAIQNNTISESELEYISESNDFNKDKYRVDKGDIVLAMTGFTMGKIGLVPDYLQSFYVNQRVGFFKLGDSDFHKSGYLFCTLIAQQFQNEIWSFGGDSQQFNVSNDQVGSIKVIQPYDKFVIEKFNVISESLFERMIIAQSSNRSLQKLKDLLLSKLATVEN